MLTRPAKVSVSVGVELPHAYGSPNPFDNFDIRGVQNYPPEMVFLSADLEVEITFGQQGVNPQPPLSRTFPVFAVAKWRDHPKVKFFTAALPRYDLKVEGIAPTSTFNILVTVRAILTLERLFELADAPQLSTLVFAENYSGPTIRVPEILVRGI